MFEPSPADPAPQPAADPRPAVTRARVLEAARALLQEEGPAAVTPLRIADRSGVARTTVYRHWPEPATLLLETLAAATEPEALSPTGNLAHDLQAFLGLLVERLADPAFASMAAGLIAQAQHDARARDLFLSLHIRRSQTLRQILQAARDTGEIRADLPIDTAVALLAGPVLFTRLVVQQDPSPALVRDVVDAFLAWARASGRRRRRGTAPTRRAAEG